MKFSRRRGSADDQGGPGKHSAGDPKGGRHARTGGSRPADDDDDSLETTPAGPEHGPYDADDAPDDDRARLDLGALRIPALPGVEIQLQAGPQGDIQQIQLSHGASRLQLGVFAAPRSEGIWDEIRENLFGALANGGAKPQEIDGEYGVELRARVKEGSGTTDVRHVGIDGPRWFLHAVYLGAAAADPDRAGPLREVMRGLVVDRGTEARPVSEALPMRLPAEAAAQLAEQQGQFVDQQAT